jgi:hypothetical protein
MTQLTGPVAEAADAVRANFAGHAVDVNPDGAGGAFVIVSDVAISSRYTPATTWLGFHLNAAYPASDVYPHYIGVLARADGRGLGEAITSTTWQGRPALQLSRRSNQWNPAVDNAANKAERILKWLADR